MLLLRIVVSAELAPATLAYLETLEVVVDLIHLPAASRRPAGDFIQAVVAPEVASVVIRALRELGVTDRGSITIDRLDASVVDDDSGSEPNADAVIWEEVEQRTAAMSQLSVSFLVYMMAATVIAAVGILTDSVVLIIGAMVVGPEFGPLAGTCVGIVQRRHDILRQAVLSLLVGFALAFAAAYAATWAFRAGGIAPELLTARLHPATLFISRPDAYSVLIAALAGIAGMLSLTTASTGTLIGVLISVTTIPAAGNIGVAAAYGNGGEVSGAMIQLGINLGVLLLAGLATLRVQRAAFARQVSSFVVGLRLLRLRELLPRRRRR